MYANQVMNLVACQDILEHLERKGADAKHPCADPCPTLSRYKAVTPLFAVLQNTGHVRVEVTQVQYGVELTCGYVGKHVHGSHKASACLGMTQAGLGGSQCQLIARVLQVEVIQTLPPCVAPKLREILSNIFGAE